MGAALGAFLGMMFAPAPGEETRLKVAEKGLEVGDMAVEKAKKKHEAVFDVSKNIISQLKEKLPDSDEVHKSLDEIESEI